MDNREVIPKILIPIVIILVGSAIFLTPTKAQAANHYVRAGAAGDGSGRDWTNACPDFTGPCAGSAMVRGDTYYVAGGSYSDPQLSASDSGSSVITIVGATIASHGTNTGWSNSYSVETTQAQFNDGIHITSDYWVIDGAVGSGKNTVAYGFGGHNDGTWAGVGLIVAATNSPHDITLRHFEIDGVNPTSIPDSTCGGAGFYAAYGDQYNITLQYLYIHHQKGAPITFRGGDNFLLEHSYFYLNRSTSVCHAEGISGGGGANGVVRYNVFENIGGTGQIIALYNTWTLDVYGNLFIRTGSGPAGGANSAWVVADNTNTGWINGLRFYNNTMVGLTGIPGVASITSEGISTNWDVRNNLWYNSASFYISQPGTGGSESYNTSLNSNTTLSGYQDISSSFAPDPFVSTTGGNFHLIGATNAGFTLASPYNTDLDGTIRGADGVWDRGAYEYVSGILYGDVSENGSVTAYDASLAAQYAVGSLTLTASQITMADVSGNGSVTAYDASLIAQYAVGLISKFPVEG